jgi:hypothetical protein
VLTADASILVEIDKISQNARSPVRCDGGLIDFEVADSQNEIAREANPGDSLNSLGASVASAGDDERPKWFREAARAHNHTPSKPA